MYCMIRYACSIVYEYLAFPMRNCLLIVPRYYQRRRQLHRQHPDDIRLHDRTFLYGWSLFPGLSMSGLHFALSLMLDI
jgi:hypothetical protein